MFTLITYENSILEKTASNKIHWELSTPISCYFLNVSTRKSYHVPVSIIFLLESIALKEGSIGKVADKMDLEVVWALAHFAGTGSWPSRVPAKVCLPCIIQVRPKISSLWHHLIFFFRPLLCARRQPPDLLSWWINEFFLSMSQLCNPTWPSDVSGGSPFIRSTNTHWWLAVGQIHS